MTDFRKTASVLSAVFLVILLFPIFLISNTVRYACGQDSPEVKDRPQKIILDFFKQRKKGIFVDVGCWHYKDSNNTYYLEKCLGWSGIAVDALAECAQGYIENRPKTSFFNFIVTDHSGAIEKLYRVPGSTGMSSTDLDFSRKHMKMYNVKDEYQVVHVPTITLTELLEKNGIKKIDFLSLDIEGGEAKALAGFDIERFRPEFVCVEGKGRGEILDYFRSHNYEPVKDYMERDEVNGYFRPKHSGKKGKA